MAQGLKHLCLAFARDFCAWPCRHRAHQGPELGVNELLPSGRSCGELHSAPITMQHAAIQMVCSPESSKGWLAWRQVLPTCIGSTWDNGSRVGVCQRRKSQLSCMAGQARWGAPFAHPVSGRGSSSLQLSSWESLQTLWLEACAYIALHSLFLFIH